MMCRFSHCRRLRCLVVHCIAILLFDVGVVFAQARPRIVAPADEVNRTALKGHLPPELQTATDLGAIEPSRSAGRMMLVLQRSPEQKAALKQYLDELHRPGSAAYHQWLTPEAFGSKYGVADEDIQKLATWLQSHGLNVNRVSKSKMSIQFSGTVGQVAEALHTSFHGYELKGKKEYSITSEPQLPKAFADVVAAVSNLNSFDRPRSTTASLGRVVYESKTPTGNPQWTIPDATAAVPVHILTPEDFATQYDLKPVYANGVNGAGQTIAVVEDGNIDVGLANAYRTLFGLPYNPPQVIVDGNDPGINEDSIEAYVDVENAGAVAPNATIKMYVAGTEGLSGGGGLAFAITRAIDDDVAQVISVSFYSPEYAGSATNDFYSSAFEQASAQGQTVIVATGDTGVADPHGLSVNGIASNPWNVAVGGTDIYVADYATGGVSLSEYWSPVYDADLGSLLKPMAEQPWNASQFGLNSTTYDPLWEQVNQILGGGGGASYCAVGTGTFDPVSNEPVCTSGWPKPSWQVGQGVPSDGVRDFPDVSLFASNGINGVLWPICAAPGECTQTAATQNIRFLTGIGGTSASAPAMAGIMALVNQKYGPQGQADYVLYPLAAQFPSSFNNISIGSNNEPCAKGAYKCSLDQNDGYYSYQVYYAHAGYNQAAGLGSVDVNQLLMNWSKVSMQATRTSLTLSATTIMHGQSVTAQVAVQGAGTATGNVAIVASPAPPNNSGQGYVTLANGSGSTTLSSLPGGTYKVYANYPGDGVNAPSKSDPIALTVAPEPSESVLTATEYVLGSATPLTKIVSGGTVLASSTPVFDVQIVNASGNADGVATGTVTYALNGAVVGVQQLDAAGFAEWSGTSLGAGAYTLSVTYSGDASYLPSKFGDFVFFVAQMPNSSVILFPDPSCTIGLKTDTCIAGTNVTFTAVVPVELYFALPPPTGTLTFALGNNQPIALPLSPNISEYFLEANEATSPYFIGALAPVSFVSLQPTASLPGGVETLTVTYSGDANYAPAIGSVNIAVNPSPLLPTTTSITLASPASTSAVTPGTLVTLSATVTGNGLTPPTGTVTLHDGGLVLTSSPILPGVNNTATATVSLLEGQLPPGDNFLTFAYSGDQTYLPGSSGTLDLPNLYGDFTLVTSTPNVVVASGGTVKVPVTVISQYNFAGVVALSCTAPAGVTCTLANASVLSSSGGGNTTVTIGALAVADNATHPEFVRSRPTLSALPVIAGLLFLSLPFRRKYASIFLFALLSISAVSTIGCGQGIVPNGSALPAAVTGSYTVLVTGISSSGTHNLPITVTVE